MDTVVWIITGGLLMSAIAMVGGVTTVLSPATLDRILLPLVSFAAGSLIGGAFFHMIPEGSVSLSPLGAGTWLVSGFTVFLVMEQLLQWHHTHQSRGAEKRRPVTYLILLGDGIHNFLGGLGIASTFLIDAKAGIIAWLAAAAHEAPQELGDFGILVHGGWPRGRALMWNFLSALTFPIGALLAYVVSQHIEVAGLVLFGAGNFIYIAASDLIPEIKAESGFRETALHISVFVSGLFIMFALAYWLH